MKLVLFLLGMAVAGYLGYRYEPNLRQQLTGISTAPVKSLLEPSSQKAPVQAEEILVDPASLTPEQLPQSVSLIEAAKFTDESGAPVTLLPGTKLKLVRVEGKNVMVREEAHNRLLKLPISGTDLQAQILANPPKAPETKEESTEEPKEESSEPAAPETSSEPQAEPAPETSAEPAPEPVPEPEPAPES